MTVPLRQICRFHMPGHGPQMGVVHDGRVFHVNTLHAAEFASMISLLRAFDAGKLPAAVGVHEPGWPLAEFDVVGDPAVHHLLAPIDHQEVWAAGVTYVRSREARREESKQGGDFYSMVYDADRPEIFFKATPHRCVGPNDEIVIRTDSDWDVPEPEMTLVISPGKQLFGYTVGNDVSSRSIEGANPLYLPQAKCYMASAALGPVVTLASALPQAQSAAIRLTIRRDGAVAYDGSTSTANMKRKFGDLLSWFARENEYPAGAFLMTGTGIVPESPFTLQAGDQVAIAIEGVGVLRNRVRRGWSS